jgi:predicted HicB family RNase H-like nuclease
MAEKTVISFKVSPELKAALAKLAAADERSLSSYIDRVLRSHVAGAAISKPAGKRK